MFKKWLIVVFVVVIQAGCASIPKQAFNKEANRGILQITLVEPAVERDVAVVNLGHPGNHFGLIGAIIASGQISAKTTEFTKVLKAKGFDLPAEFETALIGELERAGYTVQVKKVPRTKAEFLQNYNTVSAGAHAIIDTIGERGLLLCRFQQRIYSHGAHLRSDGETGWQANPLPRAGFLWL
jgi:hypothetical protein